MNYDDIDAAALMRRLHELAAEREDLQARIAAALALHQPRAHDDMTCQEDGNGLPCPTVRALTGEAP